MSKTNVNEIYEAYKMYVFEIMKDDGTLMVNIIVSQYGYVLGYIILYARSFKVLKFVSQKVFDDLNLKTIEPISKRDSLVVKIEGNYYNTKILKQIIIMLIVSAINNLIFNINILFVILKSALFSYKSLYSILMTLFIIKRSFILKIEIMFKAFIIIFEKFDCRLVSLISRSTLNSTFLYPKIFGTDRIRKFIYDFVNMLKSISVFKIRWIFFVIPMLNIKIKHFKIRYKVLHNAHVSGIIRFY